MALFGVTRSEYLRDMKTLMDRELGEANRLEQEAATWDGQAIAYGNMIDTHVASSLFYYHRVNGPSPTGRANAETCRQNAAICRRQAQVHRDKLAEYEHNKAVVLAAGQFDREGRYGS